MSWWKVILLVVGGLIVVGLVIGFFVFRLAPSNVDENNLPKIIQADFVDLDKIVTISKFRSSVGHDFSSGGETCRSMKHYFTPQFSSEDFKYHEQGLRPPPDPSTAISIYSPIDGTIVQLSGDQNDFGKQIYIRSKHHPNYMIRLFHIYPEPGITKGSKVTAGQKIGSISKSQNTDIAVQAGGFRGQFVSYFQVMPDDIFAKYQARGVKSRADLIITKEYRAAQPLECHGEQFAKHYESDPNFNEEIYLSGYQNNPYPGQ